MNYTLPNKLKLFAIILMVLGAVGIGAGFLSAPGSTAEVKQMMAAHGDDHGEASNESHDTIEDSHGDAAAHGASHDAADEQKHLEHTLHQLQNRPWSALYVAC
ncbi:MAG: quinol:cytochrome C oxidoreductase, partial [Bacteroidetes bacterium]|nr:quinol:cytochrome C oxidoreductase [Bacteroidota bacterium]